VLIEKKGLPELRSAMLKPSLLLVIVKKEEESDSEKGEKKT